MKIIVPPINGEITGFSPELDIFKRKEFGENLLKTIQNEKGELVIALEAHWGEGKTTFIKMWRGLVNEKRIPCVYFDAFENDYQSDPFLAISSEIYSLIDKKNTDGSEEFKKKAVSALKIVGQSGLRVGIKALTGNVLDETIFEDDGKASKEASDLMDKYIAKQLSKSDQDKKSLTVFKECLSTLGENISKNNDDRPDGDDHLIFIIDELDRCKPKFALSILESIKHLFSVPNVTFLLVMNRNQLEESVRCEYGRGVQASKYLQKFISIWCSLPRNNINRLPVSAMYVKDCLNRMGYEVKNHNHNIKFFEEFVEHYSLSLRDIERSLTNFAIIYNLKGDDLSEKEFMLCSFFAIVKVVYPDIYRKIANDSISCSELLDGADLCGFKVKPIGFNPQELEDHSLKNVIKLYFGTIEESTEAAGIFGCANPTLRDRRFFVSSICGCLDSFTYNLN